FDDEATIKSKKNVHSSIKDKQLQISQLFLSGKKNETPKKSVDFNLSDNTEGRYYNLKSQKFSATNASIAENLNNLFKNPGPSILKNSEKYNQAKTVNSLMNADKCTFKNKNIQNINDKLSASYKDKLSSILLMKSERPSLSIKVCTEEDDIYSASTKGYSTEENYSSPLGSDTITEQEESEEDENVIINKTKKCSITVTTNTNRSGNENTNVNEEKKKSENDKSKGDHDEDKTILHKTSNMSNTSNTSNTSIIKIRSNENKVTINKRPNETHETFTPVAHLNKIITTPLTKKNETAEKKKKSLKEFFSFLKSQRKNKNENNSYNHKKNKQHVLKHKESDRSCQNPPLINSKQKKNKISRILFVSLPTF
ncbi:conserved protein, unknown function, partial [Hepatocystis sp. ex Piliocolobus tephrosceles]